MGMMLEGRSVEGLWGACGGMLVVGLLSMVMESGLEGLLNTVMRLRLSRVGILVLGMYTGVLALFVCAFEVSSSNFIS